MTPAALAALQAAAFPTGRPWSEAEFATLLAQPGTVLSADARGYALGRVIADEAEVLSLATAPAARRQGVARAHLNALEGAARDLGARRIFLEVSADNHAAIALYQAAGYGESGRRRGYYRPEDGPAQDALILSKPLT